MEVSALDGNGAPAASLTATDIDVTVNGTAVPVISVTRAPAILQTVVVVDATTSQPLRRSEMINALGTQWMSSVTAKDRARIGVVSNPIVFSNWLPSDRPAADALVPRSLLERASAEPSPLWDAIDAAAQVLAGATVPKAVLVLSDGRATGNALGLEELAARAVVLDVSISSVSEADEKRVPQGSDPLMRVRPDASLEWLAAETGGVYLEDGIARRRIQARLDRDPFGYVKELMNTPNQPGVLLARIMNLMRQRHYVAFDGPATKGAHRLEIRARAAGLTIVAKRTYVGR